MSKVIDVLRNTRETRFSFELLPPLKGRTIDSIYKAIDPLLEFDPAYINVTYHQEEVVYKKRENGLLERKTVRKRPGTVAIAAAIQYRYRHVTVVPHLICGGFTREETEYALIDLHFLGIHNILALRGDPTSAQKCFLAEKNGHVHAADLVRQIVNMNRGIYLDDELENSTATQFSVGVAGYPEKHVEAANTESDLRYLKEKVDAGAEYIVTQMFFDNQKYFDFVRRCRDAGIEVPIVPGLKPIRNAEDVRRLPQTFHIDIPDDFIREATKLTSDRDIWQLGVEWCIAQSKELKRNGVPIIHYYTIGKWANIKKIAQAVF